MAGLTNIGWTERTWNPVTGCTKVSPGCANCYAEVIDHRFDHDRLGKLNWAFPALQGGRGVTLHWDRIPAALTWRKPGRVFVNSMSDLFHEDIPIEFIARVFVAMMLNQSQTFQILTKRPERMRTIMRDLKRAMYEDMMRGQDSNSQWYAPWRSGPGEYWIERWYLDHTDNDPKNPHLDWRNWPLKNVWLGTSVENQLWANRRIPDLLQTPAALHFVSCEPLLGAVDLQRIILPKDGFVYRFEPEIDALNGLHFDGLGFERPVKQRLGWVITGGESGNKRRAADPQWFRELLTGCLEANVPFYLKQGNGFRPGSDRLLDGMLWEQTPLFKGIEDLVNV